MKRVLIIGVTGQDGTLLADALRQEGTEILGLGRGGIVDASGRVVGPGSLSDAAFIDELFGSWVPTQVYYLAAHHHSAQDTGLSGDTSLWRDSLQVQVHGLVHVLEALRSHTPQAKLFYASSSQIYGSPVDSPQTEETRTAPDGVYGITKVTGMEVCRYYHEQHRLFTVAGILYNHESVLRKEKFLSKKICRAALAIKLGGTQPLVLGSLSARVDWGYAPDYVDAMMRILDRGKPGRYIIATGEAHTVEEFVDLAFTSAGLDYREWVTENASIIRPQKGSLVGDASKLRHDTGWKPSVTFPEMVRLLMAQTEQGEPDDA